MLECIIYFLIKSCRVPDRLINVKGFTLTRVVGRDQKILLVNVRKMYENKKKVYFLEQNKKYFVQRVLFPAIFINAPYLDLQKKM